MEHGRLSPLLFAEIKDKKVFRDYKFSYLQTSKKPNAIESATQT